MIKKVRIEKEREKFLLGSEGQITLWSEMVEKGAKAVLVRDAGSGWDSALEPFSSSRHASIQFTQSVAGMNSRFYSISIHMVSSVMTTVDF